jgi:hypothetical protein
LTEVRELVNREAMEGLPRREAAMKGTMLDFVMWAADKPEIATQMAELAARHGFELTDELSDEDLDGISGGGLRSEAMKAMWEAEQARNSQRAESHANHIQRFAQMIRQMNSLYGQAFNSVKNILG